MVNRQQLEASNTVDHISYWDNEAHLYDELYADRWSLRENALVEKSLNWLRNLESPRVLDLGCGTGLGYELINRVNSNTHYVGLDLSTEMLKRLKHKYPKAELVEGSMDDLSMFPDNSFDAVVCFFTSMSCVDSLQQVLDEAQRVLKPKGFLRISVYNRISLKRILCFNTSKYQAVKTRHAKDENLTTMALYSRKEITQLAEVSGYEVVRLDSFGVFAGFLETPKLWPLDNLIVRVLPNLAYTNDALLRLKN